MCAYVVKNGASKQPSSRIIRQPVRIRFFTGEPPKITENVLVPAKKEDSIEQKQEGKAWIRSIAAAVYPLVEKVIGCVPQGHALRRVYNRKAENIHIGSG